MAVNDYHRKKKQSVSFMKYVGIFFVLAVLLLGLFGLFWWQNGTSPVNSQDMEGRIFVVEKGSGVNQIAEGLLLAGLIKDPTIFKIIVKQHGLESKIQAGSFRLSPSMTAEQIAKSLTESSLDVWITIPEGKRAEEIADILEDTMPNYDPSWRDILNENEGYLFPDTYLFPRDAGIEMIVKRLTETFDTKYSTVTQSTSLPKEEIVIIASMIEREAKHQEDRPIVSSVMHNRLDINMALQIDATIQYAKGKVGNSWWTRITQAEYKSVDSPYNTYLSPGLPPGPISNPGLASIQAAANPADTDYIYYITDKTGVNRYARTLAEHNANIARYGL